MDTMNGISMSTELNYLCLSLVLGLVMLVIATTLGTIQRGLPWNVGPRDQPMPPLSGMAGRMDRAFQNFKETFPFFIAAVLLAQATGHHTSLTATGAALYFYCRVIYVPLYGAGIPFVRTLVWTASVVGIVLVAFTH
jgi:uncharacterized MAPEG superfamily protein